MSKVQTAFYSKMVQSNKYIPSKEKGKRYKILVELEGLEVGVGKQGIDLVLVLDISKDKNWTRHHLFPILESATRVVLSKLRPIDRLSVITFSDHAKRLCPLRLMTKDAKFDIQRLIIDNLEFSGVTNITAGIEMAVQVLNDRKFTEDRDVSIMLTSYGDSTSSAHDGSQVLIGDVPVYTFGLGRDMYDAAKVLQSIAKRSKGGTFSAIVVEKNKKTSSLCAAFAQCLAGLFTVVVQDLTLTITPLNSKIERVFAGCYPISENISDGSLTISFGNLYSDETRSILVDIVLDEVKGSDVMAFTYSYKRRRLIEILYTAASPVIISASHLVDESPEVLIEQTRIKTAEIFTKVRIHTQRLDYYGLLDTIEYVKGAKKDLNQWNGLHKSHPKVKGLQEELDQFLKLSETPTCYAELGRSFAFSAELSHSLQRFTTRGKTEKLRMFSTKAMDKYLHQVIQEDLNEIDNEAGIYLNVLVM